MTNHVSMCRNTILLEAFQHWPDQGSTTQWLPNLDFEGPYWHFTVHGTNKPMEPFAIATGNNEDVLPPPSQNTTGCLIVFILTFLRRDNVCHGCNSYPWLTDLIVIQLVKKPRSNILVTQPISHHKELGIIHRRTTGNLVCYSARHMGILHGSASIQRLDYFGGSDRHNCVMLHPTAWLL